MEILICPRPRGEACSLEPSLVDRLEVLAVLLPSIIVSCPLTFDPQRQKQFSPNSGGGRWGWGVDMGWEKGAIVFITKGSASQGHAF